MTFDENCVIKHFFPKAAFRNQGQTSYVRLKPNPRVNVQFTNVSHNAFSFVIFKSLKGDPYFTCKNKFVKEKLITR